MKKLALLLVAAAAVLGPVGTAQAKEIGSLKICGTSGCNTMSDREQLKGWESNSDPTNQAIAAAQRYYTVEIGFTDPEGTIIHHENAFWLPDGALMRFAGGTADPWWQVSSNQTAMYEKLAAGIDAFTPDLSKVTVKGKRAADPSSYLRLFGKFPYKSLVPRKAHFIAIKLTASTPNPWVSGTVTLRYDAKRHLLIRPDGYFRLPSTLGRLVMHRSSLSSKSASGSGGGRSGLYAGLGVSGLVALGVLGVARRKKMH